MDYSDYTGVKKRILYYRRLGRSYRDIVGKNRAQDYEGKFYRRNKETGTILRKPGSGKASKWNKSAKEISGEPKTLDGETTGLGLEKLLRRNGITVDGNHQPQKFLWLAISNEPCYLAKQPSLQRPYLPVRSLCYTRIYIRT